jgi:hemolysin activation/secretion protein
MHYDNLWQKLHSASFMYQVSPENTNQVEVMVGSYAMPLFDSDKRLALFAINSSSNTPVSNNGGSTTIGSGSVYGMRFVDPLPTAIKNYYHTFTAGVTYKDQSLIQNALGSNVPSHYTNLPFMLGYSGNIQNPGSLLAFNINANLSFRNFVNNPQNFTDATTHAGNFQTDFVYLNGGLSYNHNLPYGMEFAGRFNGQVTNTPLQAYEQFSLGGQQSVRGYYETQVLADDGIQGSLEVYTPKFNIDDSAEYNRIRGLLFLDGGRGWKTLDPGLAVQKNSQQDLASVGSGFRMQLWKTLTANFDVGIPFVNQIRVERGNPRLHFQVFTEF